MIVLNSINVGFWGFGAKTPPNSNLIIFVLHYKLKQPKIVPNSFVYCVEANPRFRIVIESVWVVLDHSKV